MFTQLDSGEYWLYLRKSRVDLEAEARGEGETLAKHKKALFKLAKGHNITITEVFEEIVSGESLIHRPEMLKLLNLLEERKPQAVLVMDIDRFGRGNMQEQGLILETFRNSNTKIITPRKIYDLHNEFDEEYSEFEAFMARKELKIITRRLQGGRIRSVEEGNYLGTRPPYGYNIQYASKGGRFLVPDTDQAEVVRMIFEWYTHSVPEQRMGSRKIAQKLNDLNILSYTGKQWISPSVINILKNAVYIGKIQWKKKKTKKSVEPGKCRNVATRPKEEWIDVEGKHQPIVDNSVFNSAQEILEGRYHVPYQLENGKPKISSSLAGLIKCDMCGFTMVYRPYTKQLPHLICATQSCKNKSSRYEYVEKKLLQLLEKWLHDLKIELRGNDEDKKPNQEIQFRKNSLISLDRELKDLDQQKGKLFDLLERGLYDETLFLERSKAISERIERTKESIEQVMADMDRDIKRENTRKEIIPQAESVINLLHRTHDPINKNALLKTVLHHAVYRKEQHQRNDQFELEIFPRI